MPCTRTARFMVSDLRTFVTSAESLWYHEMNFVWIICRGCTSRNGFVCDGDAGRPGARTQRGSHRTSREGPRRTQDRTLTRTSRRREQTLWTVERECRYRHSVWETQKRNGEDISSLLEVWDFC